MKQYNIRVEGKVQDVWYRDSTKKEADRIGLYGFVQNESDGSVYIEVEGEAEGLDELVQWCHKGPTKARVVKVSVEEKDLTGYEDFQVRV